MPIRNKVLGLVLALSIIPNFLAGVAINYQFTALLERQAQEIVTQFMQQSEGYLSLYLGELEQATAAAVSNDEALAILRMPAFDDFYDSLAAQRALAQAADRTLNLRTDITALDVYATNGLSQVEGGPRHYAIAELPGTAWYDRLVAGDDDSVWAYEARTKSLVYAREVTDAMDGRLLGYALARVPTYRIEGVLRRSRLGVHEYLALYDGTTRRVAGPSNLPQDLRDAILKEYAAPVAAADPAPVTDLGHLLMVNTRVGDTSLRLVMFVETASILRYAPQLRISSIAVFLVITALTILVWLQFARRLTQPLASLAQTMNAFRQGDTMRVAQVESDDEIGQVARSYNAMLERLNALIREVYEEQLHRKEAEWSALQAQINPHFLNNTLNSIASLARARGVPEITRMVSSLAKLFRIVLSEKKQQIPLRQELEYVRQYLCIQEVRYGDRLGVEFEVDADATELLVPTFILQPLVENAIEHGIEPSDAGGVVTIVARRAGEPGSPRLLVSVSDDGAGMDPELVRSAVQGKRTRNGRIGLWNVQERVRAVDPANDGIRVETAPNAGTTVTLDLPAREELDSL